jgi:hypothetical protein
MFTPATLEEKFKELEPSIAACVELLLDIPSFDDGRINYKELRRLYHYYLTQCETFITHHNFTSFHINETNILSRFPILQVLEQNGKNLTVLLVMQGKKWSPFYASRSHRVLG